MSLNDPMENKKKEKKRMENMNQFFFSVYLSSKSK